MLLEVVRKPFGLLIVWIASVTALPLVPKPEPETVRGLSVARAYGATVGKCLATSTLIYVETLIVLKDDSTLVNGTIELFVGDPIIIDCARIVPKTKHDQASLSGAKLLGTNTIEVSVVEHEPSQSNALEYSVYVYATIGPAKRQMVYH
uniref:Cadherin domain-containing protein n=1 Tax=Anopheles minimus TaxID=112268 RepID=A0A182W505_9DIPT